MISHEVKMFGREQKRYLPPKFGLDHLANQGSLIIPNTPVKVLSVLPDRTVCMGSEPLPALLPKKNELLGPFLNVINSFIR